MPYRPTLLELFTENPLLGPATGFVAGTAAGAAGLQDQAGIAPWIFLVGALIAGLLAAVASKFLGGSSKGGFAFLACIVSTFAGLGLFDYCLQKPTDATPWPQKVETVVGIVENSPRETSKTLLYEIGLQGKYAGRHIQARLMKKKDVRPKVGDELLLHGEIQALRNSGNPGEADFAAIQRRRGLSGTLFCYANAWKPTGQTRLTLTRHALRLREDLVEQYKQHFAGRDLAVLSALTLGDKSMLRSEVRDVFSETGTSHILALSGLHLGILFGIYNFFFLALFRKRRYLYIPLCLVGLAGIWAFAFLVGCPTSLVRAALMYSLVQTTMLIGGDIFSINNLSIAALFILLISPMTIEDVGFQLSFLSVAGILMFYPLLPRIPFFGKKWYQRFSYRLVSFAYSIVGVSLCAIASTLPLTAYIFHTLPVYGLLASLIAIPLAYPILLCALLFFLLPMAQSTIAIAIGWLLQALFDGLQWVASLPGASCLVYPTLLTTILAYAFLVLLYSTLVAYSRWKGVGIILLVTGCSIIEISARRSHQLTPQIVFYQNYHAPALHLIVSKERSYLWSTAIERADSTLGYVKRTFWRREQLAAPCLLRGDTMTENLIYADYVLQFRHRRIGLLYERIKGKPQTPLPTDYLYIVRGWNRPVAEALQVFRPDTIILDTGLSDFYERRYRREADSLNIPYKDMRRTGAVVVNVND